MKIGIFADTHDHLDNLRAAVAEFNRRECDLVLFAGDLVSTFAIPPLRKLKCRLIASFGDNAPASAIIESRCEKLRRRGV